jgi:hypothetical protein
MHVSFALFADAANLSQEGKLNVLGVFDAVHVGQFPALHPRATFVIRLKGTPADAGVHRLGVRWVNPRGTELWSTAAELGINPVPQAAGEIDMPVILAIDLPLDVPGDYQMLVDIDEMPHAQSILHVRSGAPPVVPPAPGQLVS